MASTLGKEALLSLMLPIGNECTELSMLRFGIPIEELEIEDFLLIECVKGEGGTCMMDVTNSGRELHNSVITYKFLMVEKHISLSNG